MDNITVIICICAIVSMLPAIYVFPDKSSKLIMGYTLLGVLVCMVSAGINDFVLRLCGGDMLYLTTCISPVIEEVMKALPVLYFALVFSDDRKTLLSISYAMGLGFAMLENMMILTDSLSGVTILWAFIRGFGAARMHSACTAVVGRGIAYVRKRRKLFYCGTLSLLITAIIIHALFNTLIQSEYRELAFVMVMLMYALQFIDVLKPLFARKTANNNQ